MREASVMRYLRALAAVLTLLGLYLSLRLVLSQATLDPDSSHSLVLWQGLREHGIEWLASWRFTQDNWLLSLFPLHFLGYALFGTQPFIPLIGGWLIFVAAASVAGALAWQCGAQRAAPFAAAVLLFAGLEAHLRGLLAYSTTHNSSNLFGLCALWLVLSWLREEGSGKLVALLLVLCAVALSDPWLLPAYNLPLLLLALTFLGLPMLGVPRKRALALLGVAALSLVVARTHFFGLVNLPSIDYQMGGWSELGTRLVLLLRELGALVQLLPFLQNAASALASAAVVVLITLALLIHALRQGLLRDTLPAALAFFTLYSSAGICAAFLLSNSNASFALDARLLINCLYLVVPLLAVLSERYWTHLPSALRYAAPVLALGFVVSGVISTAPARQGEGWHFAQRNAVRVLDFLKANDLRYGYGGYWGAAANAVTALSDGAVIVRPINFDSSNGRAVAEWRPQSSLHWYTAADLPQGQRDVFIMLSTEDGAAGGCPALPLCDAALTQQFGTPVRRLDLDAGHRVLVWDHPLPELWIGTDAPPTLPSFKGAL
jgi:hypothetical protein